MSKPGEYKTVQVRVLAYAKAIHLCQGYGGQVGWMIVSREEAEQRRRVERMKDEGGRMKGGSLFFDDLLDAQLRTFNPRYAEAEGALLGQLRHLHTDIDDNRDFLFSPIVLH
jgi:type I restriction enzyme R subunit